GRWMARVALVDTRRGELVAAQLTGRPAKSVPPWGGRAVCHEAIEIADFLGSAAPPTRRSQRGHLSSRANDSRRVLAQAFAFQGTRMSPGTDGRFTPADVMRNACPRVDTAFTSVQTASPARRLRAFCAWCVMRASTVSPPTSSLTSTCP